METMKEFVFYPQFSELKDINDLRVGNKVLNKLAVIDEVSLGNRQVGNRSYHIFYFKNQRFAAYYHGGGTDALFSSKKLEDVLSYVNGLDPKDFQ